MQARRLVVREIVSLVCCWCLLGLVTGVGCIVISLEVAIHQVTKGAWRMPWHLEAMKDVASCVKPGGVASEL